MEKKNIHNGHEYVDLGLPSGTLWATENFGNSSLYSFDNKKVVNKAELFRKDAREIADKVKRLKGDIATFGDKYKLDKRNIIDIIKILNGGEE